VKAELRAGAALDLLTEREVRVALEDFRKGLASALRVRPIMRKLSADGTVDANGFAIVSFGSPPEGFEWDTRRVTLTAQDATSDPAGNGFLFVGDPPSFVSAGNLPSPFECVASQPSLPGVTLSTADQRPVAFTEALFYLWTGGVLGTRLFGRASVIERVSTQEETPIPVFPVDHPNGKRT